MARAALGMSSDVVMDSAVISPMLEPIEATLAALGPIDRPERATLLARRAFVANFMEADYDRMAAGLEEAEAVALRCGDPEASLDVRRYQCVLLRGSPHFALLERIARESFDAALRTGNAFRAGIDVRDLVGSTMARGDRAAVESLLETEFRSLVERAASRPARQSLLSVRGALALAEGRFDDAKRIAAVRVRRSME